MKFTVERSVLLKSLAHIQSVVERRTTIAILSNVKIEAAAGKLHLTATDMEISVTEVIPADVKTPATTTLPAQILYEIVRKLPEGAQVEFSEDKKSGQMQLKAGKSKFNLLSLPSDNFPVLEQGEMPVNFRISAKDLLYLIDKARFAVSTEETRYYLNGIFLHSTNDSGNQVLRAAATDGHRLARVSLPLPAGAEGIQGVIIPRKTVAEIKKLLAEYSGDVEIAVSDTKIKFVFDSVTLVSKLIDGTFPDYERVIPKDNKKILEVSAKTFAEAVDRVSTVSVEKARTVKLTISKGLLVVSANSPDGSTASEDIEAEYSADQIETGFNYRYVLEMMAEIEGDIVQFIFADSGSPAIVRDPTDVGTLYVIMPMRV